MNIRVFELDGNPWFVGADSCKAVELAPKNGGYGHHFAKLDASEKRLTSLSDMGVKRVGRGGPTAMLLISEAGLYKLIMRSDKPEAKDFQTWVARDVLPTIRKTGSYVQGEAVRLAVCGGTPGL